MILVDTSVWIKHLRSASATLSELLGGGEVLCHPFVIGELALGNLRLRDAILSDLHDLPQAIAAEHGEVLRLIERQTLFARGIGYVDAHLLAATRLTAGSRLWTHDRRLHAVAAQLDLAARLPHRSGSKPHQKPDLAYPALPVGRRRDDGMLTAELAMKLHKDQSDRRG